MGRAERFRGVGRRLFDAEKYYNTGDLTLALDTIVRRHPKLAQKYYLPHATEEGRLAPALWIRKEARFDRPTVFFNAGSHAREWVPPDAVISFASDLLDAHAAECDLAYGNQVYKARTITHIIDSLNIVIVPSLNPDGHCYSQNWDVDRSREWRKNRAARSVEIDGKKVELNGVDINRNFPFLWHYHRYFDVAPDDTTDPEALTRAKLGISDDPTEFQTYRGPEPLSERETLNFISVLEEHVGIKWAVDVHSQARQVMYPWSFDDNQTLYPEMNFNNCVEADRLRRGHRKGDVRTAKGPAKFDPRDDYREYMPCEDEDVLWALSKLMSDASALYVNDIPYEHISSFRSGRIIGSADDYCYSRHLTDPEKGKVFSFTLECGSGRDKDGNYHFDFKPTVPNRTAVVQEISSALMACCKGIVECFL